MRLRAFLALIPMLATPCLQSSGEEGWHGPLRWAGCSRRDVHLGGDRPLGSTADVEGYRDERAGVGGSGSEHWWSSSPMPRRRDTERVAIRALRAARSGDRGHDATRGQGGEGRSAGRLGAGRGAADWSDSDTSLQGAAAPGGAAERGTYVSDRHSGRGASEEPPEGSAAVAGHPGRERCVRQGDPGRVVGAVAGVWSSFGGGVAGAGAGRASALEGGRRG